MQTKEQFVHMDKVAHGTKDIPSVSFRKELKGKFITELVAACDASSAKLTAMIVYLSDTMSILRSSSSTSWLHFISPLEFDGGSFYHLLWIHWICNVCPGGWSLIMFVTCMLSFSLSSCQVWPHVQEATWQPLRRGAETPKIPGVWGRWLRGSDSTQRRTCVRRCRRGAHRGRSVMGLTPYSIFTADVFIL